MVRDICDVDPQFKLYGSRAKCRPRFFETSAILKYLLTPAHTQSQHGSGDQTVNHHSTSLTCQLTHSQHQLSYGRAESVFRCSANPSQPHGPPTQSGAKAFENNIFKLNNRVWRAHTPISTQAHTHTHTGHPQVASVPFLACSWENTGRISSWAS